MTTAITPEIIGLETQVLEASPMTETEEKELVILKTSITVAYADKLERDLAIGSALLTIFRRKLYRSSKGGRSWTQWLADESGELTNGRGPINESTALYLRGFYRFRNEILQRPGPGPADSLPLPSSPKQIRPLLGQLDTHPEAAVEMWKAACSQAGTGKIPTFDQVNRAALAYKASEENEARRLTETQQDQQRKAVKASVAASLQKSAPAKAPEPIAPREPVASPRPAASWSAAPSVAAWEMKKDDGDLDAGAECRELSQALNNMQKAIGVVRALLYGRINTYGSEYIDFLRQVDAGVYSIGDIDQRIQIAAEDIDFVLSLLTQKTGPGELSRSTLDVNSFPIRG